MVKGTQFKVRLSTSKLGCTNGVMDRHFPSYPVCFV